MDQALPSQYPDLGSLFENMPAIAAMQVGTQQRLADQNNKSLQDAFSANEAFQAQKRPLDLEKLTADTEGTRASTGYHNALSRSTNVDSDIKEGTKDSTIKATNSANKTKVGADEITQLEQAGDLYRQVGAQVAGAPSPWQKVALAKKLLGDHVQQGPEFDQFLLKHADNLHTYFTDLGNNIFNASRQAKMEASKEEANQKRTETQTGSAEKIAQANIDAGRWNRSSRTVLSLEQNIDKEGDPIKKYTMLRDAQVAATNDGDKEAADHYRARADALEPEYARNLAARGGGQTVVTQEPGGKPVLRPKSDNTAKSAGDAWIDKAMKANPGLTREQVVAEGKKRGKL